MKARARWMIWVGLMGLLALSGCRILRDEFFFVQRTAPDPVETPDRVELSADRDA